MSAERKELKKSIEEHLNVKRRCQNKYYGGSSWNIDRLFASSAYFEN